MRLTRRRQFVKHPQGFTILEVVVLLAIGALFAIYLAPALSTSRKASRIAQCKNNLRQIGIGMHVFAESDPRHRLCSGAYDWRRDGCPSKYGWPADLLHIGAASVQTMQCTENGLQGVETLNDLLMAAGTDSGGLPPNLVSRFTEDRCNADEGLAFTLPDSAERADQIAEFLNLGYGTNYCSSWFLVRTKILTDMQGGDMHAVQDWPATSLGGAFGPLDIDAIESSPLPAGNIPILGCAGPRIGGATFDRAIPGYPRIGESLGQTFNDGPAYWDAETSNVTLLQPGTLLNSTTGIVAWEDDALPDSSSDGDAGSDGRLWLQDTRGWFAAHAGSRRSCNIMMADGSVKALTDLNGDGYLNPGFRVVERDDQDRYRDGIVELNPFEVYCGPTLSRRLHPDR